MPTKFCETCGLHAVFFWVVTPCSDVVGNQHFEHHIATRHHSPEDPQIFNFRRYKILIIEPGGKNPHRGPNPR
jgi:hypothetical protein